jgi:hypothetical protein
MASAVHHVFPRRKLGTAFEPDNGLSLCNEDHDEWARQCPQECHDILMEKIGGERYAYLEARSREVVRLRDADYRNIKNRLEEIIKGAGEAPSSATLPDPAAS